MNGDRGRIVNRVLALFVFVVVLVVYVRTMAASVSFWDCGEFIACAHILGIPHPPGAPLHGLVGRLFSLLPLFGTVARRVNFLSALTGALAAGMLYLVVERVARGWFGEGMGWRGRLLGMVGGVTAGLFMAFSDTYWSNAVEAEVYGPAMFLMVLATWLVLRWQEVREQPGGDHVLLLLVYLLFLGIGIHQTAFLVYFPLFWLFVVLVDRERLFDWRYWLVTLLLGIMIVFSLAEPFLVVGGVLLLISFMGMEVGSRVDRRRWRFCFWLVLLAFLGFTLQAFIPLRSALDPVIDENNPDNWERFMAYLEREQYGQQSMLESMFRRKGSWASQFGVHERMGFWGFFRQGWAPVNWWPLVLGMGLLGMVVGWFRERRRWLLLMALMVLCSLVIVLWMNFSDGTRGVQLEVRDRDYFFTPTYVVFSLWMGLGVSGLLWLVLRYVRGVLGQLVFWVLLVVLLVSPMGTLGYNYHRHDRSRNYIAHDYGYNILDSCDRGGILFTNGDNDTFPLWYLQEVEGVRKDVRVVNLSLLNTSWYIKQLRDMEPKVPMELSDYQINRLMPVRLKDGTVLRIQDQMVQEIVRANNWELPVYFAVTVPPGNRPPLSGYLQMEAMVYRLTPEKKPELVNVARSRKNLWEVYRFRGMADTTMHHSDNTRRLLYNLSSAFISLADAYYRKGQSEEAMAQLQRAAEVLTGDWRPHAFMADLYVRSGDYRPAVRELSQAIGYNPEFFVLHHMMGSVYRLLGEVNQALVHYERAYQLNADSRSLVLELAELYESQDSTEKARDLLGHWVSRHPGDTTAAEMLREWSSPQRGG